MDASREVRCQSSTREEAQGIFKAAKLFCDGGYVTLCICDNPSKFIAQRANLSGCILLKTNLGYQYSQERMQTVAKEFNCIANG